MERKLSYRKEEIEDYGGGGRPGKVGANYFYLVVSGKDKTVSVDDIQKFFKKGASLDDKSIFVFVDIASDERMRKDLESRPDGPALFDRIESKAPVLLISETRLVEADPDEVELFPISDFDKGMENIARRIGSLSAGKKQGTLRFLKRLNAYVVLKPTFWGMGFNLNEVLSDVIGRLEGAKPG